MMVLNILDQLILMVNNMDKVSYNMQSEIYLKENLIMVNVSMLISLIMMVIIM